MIDAQGQYFEKRSASKLDFTIDWSDFLGSDTIDAAPGSSTWSTPAGLIQEANPAPSQTGTTTTIWLSGGAEGSEYAVLNQITTVGGRIAVRALRIKVVPAVPATPEYSDAQLKALKNAYAQGVLSVEYDNKRVVYRSLSDMETIISRLENSLGGSSSSGTVRHSLASFRKG